MIDFVRANLPNLPSSSSAQLQFLNNLSSNRDRRFLSDLADALKLQVTYDEFNDDDENVITVRFDETLIQLAREEEEDDADVKGPLDGASDESSEDGEASEAEELGIVHLSLKDQGPSAASTPKTNGSSTPAAGAGDQPEWKKAVDRVLARYEKAEIIREMTQAETEAEAEQQLVAKMDQWKKDYYRVRPAPPLLEMRLAHLLSRSSLCRRNSSLRRATRRPSISSSTGTSRDCSGFCGTTMLVSHPGAGSTTTITRRR